MAYFQDFAKGQYLADYDAILGKGVADLYRAPDTWENFDRLRPILGRRFAEWKAGELFSKDATQVHGANLPGQSSRLRRLFLIVFCAISGTMLMAWYLWPPLDFHGRQRVNEAAAVATLHHIHELQAQYAIANPTRGFSCFLDLLEERSGGEMIVQAFPSSNERSGYGFAVATTVGCYVKSPLRLYQITAVPLAPGKTGVRAFCSDQEGVIWYDDDGSANKCLSAREPI
jgi:hypothetical protein